jgi:hypothetical protein
MSLCHEAGATNRRGHFVPFAGNTFIETREVDHSEGEMRQRERPSLIGFIIEGNIVGKRF